MLPFMWMQIKLYQFLAQLSTLINNYHSVISLLNFFMPQISK